MKIAIIILNWNGKKLLEQFLPSVLKFSKEAEIYVADNASTDDSIAFIKSNYSKIKIIKNECNYGFAKGYNEAVKNLEEDVFCFLNNDIEVSENWLIPIINYYKTNKFFSIVQPKILDYKDKTKFEYAGAAGGFLDKFGYPYCKGRIFNTIEKDKGQYNKKENIFWASGACLFINADLFRKLKGFDESFFAHMEEIDLCWRAQNFGYVINYIPDSVVYHLGGATLEHTNPRKTFLNFRNSLFTLVKNAKGNIFYLVFIRLILDGIAGLKFLLELKPTHTLAIIKAHISFYYNLLRLVKQRKDIQPSVKYYKKPSIVLLYFLKKKTTFNSL
ncbi:MAG: glycosyltransferase family 2 protein [Flavobacteriaceae bacterium]|nr:glycosyltransferase family 2 protein [Bacteroidia bacterium]NNK83563.1 glycosyltransferase family 2 protein [Flavobacteriaceae bacterium]